MKKTTIGAILIMLAMVLTACGSSASAATGTTNSNSGSGAASRTASRTTILAVGTMKLEGGPQAVDKTMAVKLLPLWQLMTQLNSSSSTAPQEVTAVEDDIQTTMTSQQVQAIQSMQITQRDVFALLQQSGAASTGQNGSTRTGNNNRGGGNGGGGPGFLFLGGGPNFGGPRPGTGTPTAAGSGTATSASSTALITQLIKLLQSKIQGG